MIKKIISLEVRESQRWYENEGKSVNKEYTQSLVWLMAVISWGMCNGSLLMGKVLGLLFFWEHDDLIVLKWRQKV